MNPWILNRGLPNPHRKINGHFAPMCAVAVATVVFGHQGQNGLLRMTLQYTKSRSMGCICKFCTNHNSFILSLTLLYEEDPFARSWPPSRRWRQSAAPLPPSGLWWTAFSRTHHKAACLKVCVTRHSTVQHYQDHAATCIYAWATSSQRDPNHLKILIYCVAYS